MSRWTEVRSLSEDRAHKARTRYEKSSGRPKTKKETKEKKEKVTKTEENENEAMRGVPRKRGWRASLYRSTLRLVTLNGTEQKCD